MRGLCVISDERGAGDLALVSEALEGGADIIQLRHKGLSGAALTRLALEARRLTAASRRRLIINDRLNVALEVGADGVHLGENDLPVKAARRLGGPGLIIGASAGRVDTALAAQQAGADYLGVGPIYPTTSKPDARAVIGLAGLSSICRAVDIPVIAIGGIDSSRVSEVMAAGAAGVAVISAVAGAADRRAATGRIKELVDASIVNGGGGS
jgi:thiamine-phosphate pyrophosphorylase